ncbi:MAG: hypothetical protein ACRD2O_03055 [Terriglobia bacterium]
MRGLRFFLAALSLIRKPLGSALRPSYEWRERDPAILVAAIGTDWNIGPHLFPEKMEFLSV